MTSELVPPKATTPQPGRFDRFLPPTPLARKLSLQSILFAVGEGTFITGSAVFFTQIVGLSAAQVGLGLTVAGIASFFFAVPLGKMADRVGPKRMWAAGSFGSAGLYAVWPCCSRSRPPGGWTPWSVHYGPPGSRPGSSSSPA